jgi:NAD(P)-dependent dehydrogenase (short-subunit alcohol dehydrogenase family)
MLRLSGKVAFITGGGTGIGRECALAFAREGAQVAVAGRRKEPLDAVAAEIAAAAAGPAAVGGESLAISCDVTQRSSVEDALAAAEKHFGRLDTIVNNAGAVVVATVEHTSDADWDRVLAANLTGTFFVSRAALAPLRRAGGGSIINIGSVLGLVARKDRAAYCAAKAGVSGLTRAMALDHAHERIRVNCICPTIVETELGMQSIRQTPNAVAEIQKRIAEIPIGRLGKPDDVAMMAVYLASEDASWVTGVSFPLDGGLTAY